MLSSVAAACSSKLNLTAEPLAEREAPGPVDAAAVGGVDHELHAACLVEEALEDQRIAGGQRAERAMRRGEIVDDLLGRCTIESGNVIHDPVRPFAASPSAKRCSSSRRKRETDWESSLLRAGASPSQNGIVGGFHAHPPRAPRCAQRG